MHIVHYNEAKPDRIGENEEKINCIVWYKNQYEYYYSQCSNI